jgi:hypothetical protein
MALVSDVWRKLEAAEAGDLPLVEFERWVYSTPELVPVLGQPLALEFLALDYRQGHARHDLRKLVLRAYDQHRPGELKYDMARRVAEEFLAGDRDVWRTAAAFARMCHSGTEDWVPLDFLYIDSELDAIAAPETRDLWDSEALVRHLDQHRPLLACYEATLQEAVDVVLRYLDSRDAAEPVAAPDAPPR